jgi:hypothetical protein
MVNQESSVTLIMWFAGVTNLTAMCFTLCLILSIRDTNLTILKVILLLFAIINATYSIASWLNYVYYTHDLEED